MKRLFNAFVVFVETKLDEMRARQSAASATAPVATPAAAAAPYPPAAHPKRTMSFVAALVIIVVSVWFSVDTSCSRTPKATGVINAPEPASADTIRTANEANRKQFEGARAVNPLVPPGGNDIGQPRDLPVCQQALSAQTFTSQAAGQTLTCAFVPAQQRWAWMPSAMNPNAQFAGMANGNDPSQYGQNGQAGGSGRGGERGASESSPAERAQQQQQQFETDRQALYLKSLSAPPIAISRNVSAGDPASASSSSGPSEKSPAAATNTTADDSSPERFPYSRADGPTHTIRRGQMVQAQFDTAIKGDFSGQVQCHLTEPLYLENTDILLLPAGTVLLGESSAVDQANQKGIAVAFDQINFRDGYSLALGEKIAANSPDGSAGARGDVNNHLMSKIAVAAAVGIVGGLSQIGGYSSGYGINPAAGVYAGIARQTGQEGTQILQQQMNRPPEISIKPGTRLVVQFRKDVPNVPEFAHHRMIPGAF